MKRIIIILTILLAILPCFTLSAQFYSKGGYDFYYDYDHRVVVRSCVACQEDYQGLWNGDIVRVIGDTKYIYHNGSRILYGNKIWLEHTGDYTVERGGWQYLYDCEGRRKGGVYGQLITVLWSKNLTLLRGGYYYLYTIDGERLGNIYSDKQIHIYWNGFYCFHSGNYYRIADPNGERISSIYSDSEPELMPSNHFRVTRGSQTYLYDTSGNRVH